MTQRDRHARLQGMVDRAKEREDTITQRMDDALTHGLGANTDAMLRRGLLLR